MNTFFKTILVSVATAFCATSCIQDEALNTECDILSCSLPEGYLVAAPKVDNYTVTLQIQDNVDISKLAPEFEITPGATITPASGSVQDFLYAENNTINYTVTSQDGAWRKVYPVRVVQNMPPSEYFFNVPKLDPQRKYSIFDEVDTDGAFLMSWASGNPGYVLCGVADVEARKKYGDSYKDHVWEFFPTRAVFNGEVSLVDRGGTTFFMVGNEPAVPEYIHLETCSTGSFGTMVGMPIAAGNIFQGFFDISQAIANPRGATKFGEPYRYVPQTFKGRYRYKAGPTFTNEKGQVEAGRLDECSIYALFYETDDNVEYIDGSIHDADFKHPNLVAIAMVDTKGQHETNGWVEFDTPFEMTGRAVDYDKLAHGGYKIGIVISSSADGDYFRGAVGSTLDVADLKIINTNTETE